MRLRGSNGLFCWRAAFAMPGTRGESGSAPLFNVTPGSQGLTHLNVSEASCLSVCPWENENPFNIHYVSIKKVNAKIFFQNQRDLQNKYVCGHIPLQLIQSGAT